MKLKKNRYVVQGYDVSLLAHTYGTPLYIYDTASIDHQISIFKKAFSGVNVRINYACKANTNLCILKYMKHRGLCLDTVSLQEVKMGLSTGFDPGEIIFTPNCVDFDEITEAVSLGVRINIENLSNLQKFGSLYGKSFPVCIRLNPYLNIGNTENAVNQWHQQSKFGISADQLSRVKEIEKDYGLIIDGIHIHSRSVIMSQKLFMEGARKVFDIAKNFKRLEFIDFGGGIKVDVGDGDQVTDIMELGKLFQPIFKEFCRQYGRELEVWFEPGRFLIMNAGTLLAKCVVLKKNGNTNFVGLDTGFNHLIRPMLYGAYHQIINTSNPQGQLRKYNVVGNICEIDNLAVGRKIHEVREGDLIAIRSAGAYGYSMASNYNSRYKPAEILVHQNRHHLIRKRDTYQDLVNNQYVVDFN